MKRKTEENSSFDASKEDVVTCGDEVTCTPKRRRVLKRPEKALTHHDPNTSTRSSNTRSNKFELNDDIGRHLRSPESKPSSNSLVDLVSPGSQTGWNEGAELADVGMPVYHWHWHWQENIGA